MHANAATAFISDFLHSFVLFLLRSLLLFFPLWVSETCSVFHYQWKKWGDWLKKGSPISINTKVIVENESKLLK